MTRQGIVDQKGCGWSRTLSSGEKRLRRVESGEVSVIGVPVLNCQFQQTKVFSTPGSAAHALHPTSTHLASAGGSPGQLFWGYQAHWPVCASASFDFPVLYVRSLGPPNLAAILKHAALPPASSTSFSFGRLQMRKTGAVCCLQKALENFEQQAAMLSRHNLAEEMSTGPIRPTCQLSLGHPHPLTWAPTQGGVLWHLGFQTALVCKCLGHCSFRGGRGS